MAATSPSLLVRTQSVSRGKRKSYRMMSVTTAGELIDPLATISADFSSQHEVSSGKRLRMQLGAAISEKTKIYVDLSQRWDNLDSAAGARTAPVPGLLDAGADKKLTLDLSNYRPGALREGARIRNEKISNDKDWRKAFKDLEVGLLVQTLAAELSRISKNPAGMPELKLICRDQPLFTAVYPLVKCLAANAEFLPQLKKLDLGRYSRSADACEASLPTDKAQLNAYDKFIDRLAQLVEWSPSLHELGLRMNGVDSFALAVIADALSHNRGLARLDLSSNPLCTETSEVRTSRRGIRALARALNRDAPVKDLDLSFCGIDGRTADLLAQALVQNKNLQRIHLGGNPIPPGHPIFKDKRVSTHRLAE